MYMDMIGRSKMKTIVSPTSIMVSCIGLPIPRAGNMVINPSMNMSIHIFRANYMTLCRVLNGYMIHRMHTFMCLNIPMVRRTTLPLFAIRNMERFACMGSKDGHGHGHGHGRVYGHLHQRPHPPARRTSIGFIMTTIMKTNMTKTPESELSMYQTVRVEIDMCGFVFL
jgi:hypothetical protein